MTAAGCWSMWQAASASTGWGVVRQHPRLLVIALRPRNPGATTGRDHIDPLTRADRWFRRFPEASESFPRPILHGMCTYGIACKAIVHNVFDGDVSPVRQLRT